MLLIGKAYAYANKTVYIDNDNFLAGQGGDRISHPREHRRSPIWAATTLIFSPPTAGAAIRRRWHWRISPSGGLLRGNADAGQRRRGRARCSAARDRPTAIVVSDDLLGMTLGRARRRTGFPF